MTVTETRFLSALLDPTAAIPDLLSDGDQNPAGARFNVYRNNVAVSLTEALHTGFPVIAKLLGKENMDGLAGLFLRAQPPSSPLLMLYGAGFPAFLDGMEQLSHLGYLGDVARLELAIRQSYHAADAAPIAPEALGQIAPDDLMQSRLELAPATRLVRSVWPIWSIWQANTQDGAPVTQNEGQNVLIARPEFDPEPHLLPLGAGTFIDALMGGATLGDAHDTTLARAAGFDLGQTLALLLNTNSITKIVQKGSP